MNLPQISLILPVYNEAPYLTKQISALKRDLTKVKLENYELIIVENGSQDNSKGIIRKLKKLDGRIRLISLPENSYGDALRAGLLAAKGEQSFIINVDYFEVGFMVQALKLLKAVDVVVGSKTLYGSQDKRGLSRSLITYIFNALLRLFLNYPGTDTHGIKGFRNSRQLKMAVLKCRAHHELFDTELVLRLTRSGGLLVELPVVVSELRPSRYSQLVRLGRTAKDALSLSWFKYIVRDHDFKPELVVLDDYGISGRVNRAIIATAKSQSDCMVSILATHVKPSEVADYKSEVRANSCSVHLNLVQGQPVSNREWVPTLINKEGNFFHLPVFLIKLFMNQINFQEIKFEWEAQIEKLIKAGLTPKHLDSHQNVHCFKPLDQIISYIAKQHKIKEIRSVSSVKYRLSKWPLKYLMFIGLEALFKLRYSHNHEGTNLVSQEVTWHPGSFYD